jgi:DNA invertase Pin-like site-specific DNA recombinase
MPGRPIITYIRVSTSQQGRSGLGIEAQRATLRYFSETEGYEAAHEFLEVETGKGSDALDRRPQLKAALAAARKLKCHVAVAKLDRLSRDVHFISGLMAHKVPFLVAETVVVAQKGLGVAPDGVAECAPNVLTFPTR